jgi:hypothetical protein
MSQLLTFTVNRDTVGVIVDQDKKKPLGTAFMFLQTRWAVTAKHVIVDRGVRRRNLELVFLSKANVLARVLFVHPILDIAVLEVDDAPCLAPLMPSNVEFSSSKGFITLGYKPSLGLSVHVNSVAHFVRDVRDRVEGAEEVIYFDAPFAEGGHSGGPVLGECGGVVGIIIEDTEAGASRRACATSVKPLLRELQFPQI